MRVTLFLASIFFFCNAAFSIDAYFDLKKYRIPGTDPYVETHLSFPANGVGYHKLETGMLQAEVEATLIFTSLASGEIVDYRKNIVQSPFVTDSTLTDFLDIQVFSLNPGTYKVDLELKDLHATSHAEASLSQVFKLEFQEKEIDFADLTFLISATPTKEQGPMVKSGVKMVPHVSDYFASHQDKVIFYTEIYNTLKTFGDSMFLLKTYISDQLGTEAIGELQKMERATAKEVLPLVQSFDISKLPTGKYALNVEVRDRFNDLIANQRIDFRRNNFNKDATEEVVQMVDIKNSFVSLMTNRDSLLEHLNSCHPIASNLERNSIETQMRFADLPTLQKYFFYFWSRRSEENPELAWENYYVQVQYVEELYGTRVKKGYETDRGRVYLQYGPPNTLVQRHNPPNVLPYEIWHYYKIENFNNKRFLFYSREAVAIDFVLLHSDMLGEVSNNDWPTIMRTENVEISAAQSSQNRQNRLNSFSGDELEDLFYNPR